jgi:recombination protein RecA
MPLARAELESLLRSRQLDRTLTTALPSADPQDEYASGASGVTALDARLGGGFPRGQLSEIVGPRSSGRSSLLVSMLAAATARGELVAVVDALDMFDVESAAAAGVDLDRLLWVRGHVAANPGLCHDMNQRAMEQAIRALTLVLQAGNFGVVAFDAGEAPPVALRRLPFTTWLRLQRMVEGRPTICVLLGSEPMARSSAGLTVRLGRVGQVGREGQERQERQEGSACGPSEAPEGSARSAPPSESERGWGPASIRKAKGRDYQTVGTTLVTRTATPTMYSTLIRSPGSRFCATASGPSRAACTWPSGSSTSVKKTSQDTWP